MVYHQETLGADPALTVLLNFDKSPKVGIPSCFTVATKSSDPNKKLTGGEKLDVKIVANGTEFKAKVTDHKDGQYAVEYTPTVEGEASVDVSLVGAPISGSPFSVIVTKPGICHLCCFSQLIPLLEAPVLSDITEPATYELTEDLDAFKVLIGGAGLKGGKIGTKAQIFFKVLLLQVAMEKVLTYASGYR